jgi:uncharacterized membrane protein (DUF485 family)
METTKVKPEDVAPSEKEKAARKNGPLYDADDVGRISDLLSEYADKLGEDVDRLSALDEKKKKRVTKLLAIIFLDVALIYFYITPFVNVFAGKVDGALRQTMDLIMAFLILLLAIAVTYASLEDVRRTNSERDELRWGIRSNADSLETLVRTASQILEHKEHTAVRELELSLRLGEAEARLRQARVLVGEDDD